LYGIEQGKALDDLTLEEFQQFSPAFQKDIYEAISLTTCVEKRNTIGAPGHQAMEKEIAEAKEYLKKTVS
ncbi:MAG TPA: argininosuccinate lyase, partial [Ruminococcaceae bacterium]|nr:argininosuccinate lyase [Oscillospiraceae bacterium]